MRQFYAEHQVAETLVQRQWAGRRRQAPLPPMRTPWQRWFDSALRWLGEEV